MHTGDAGRDRFPRNNTVVELRDHGEVRTLEKGDAWGIGDVAGFAVWQVSPGGPILPALTMQMMVSLPTGDETELQGLGKPSVSLGGVASKRLWNSPSRRTTSNTGTARTSEPILPGTRPGAKFSMTFSMAVLDPDAAR